MPHGIALTVITRSSEQFLGNLKILSDCMGGYFNPSAGSVLHLPPPGEKESGKWHLLGSLYDHQATYETYEDYSHGTFARLPTESVNQKFLWTTSSAPDIQPAVIGSLEQSLEVNSIIFSLFGNIGVLFPENIPSEPRGLFREVIDCTSGDILDSLTDPDLIRFRPILRLQATRRLHLNTTWFVFDSFSEMWLENGNAFGGVLNPTARQNTSILASRVRDFVLSLGDQVEEVALYPFEGEPWNREGERFHEAFSIIPGLQVG